MSRQEITDRVAEWVNNDESLLAYCINLSSKDLKDYLYDICKVTHPYDQSVIYITPGGDDLTEVYFDDLKQQIEEQCEHCDKAKSDCNCDFCDNCNNTIDECTCDNCENCDNTEDECTCDVCTCDQIADGDCPSCLEFISKNKEKSGEPLLAFEDPEDDKTSVDFQKLHRGY
jgi:hypothetical protein